MQFPAPPEIEDEIRHFWRLGFRLHMSSATGTLQFRLRNSGATGNPAFWNFGFTIPAPPGIPNFGFTCPAPPEFCNFDFTIPSPPEIQNFGIAASQHEFRRHRKLKTKFVMFGVWDFGTAGNPIRSIYEFGCCLLAFGLGLKAWPLEKNLRPQSALLSFNPPDD